MSDISVSDRPIVRYPDVAEHMMTCPTCKAAGSLNELTYNGGHPWWPNGDRRCAAGRALDQRLIDDYSAVVDDVREQVGEHIKPIIRKAALALGVEPQAIAECIGLDDFVDLFVDESK